MKKIYFAILCLVISANVFAGGGDAKSLTGIQKRDKGMVSRGFYVHVGLGFNAYRVPQHILDLNDTQDGYTYVLPAHTHSYFQPTIEIGNQFMFYRGNDEKWGIGMNISWLTLGYGSYDATVPLPNNGKVENTSTKISDIQLGLLRLGPMLSYGISDNIAVDAFFNFNPQVRVGIAQNDLDASYVIYGLNMAPGIKLRYKVFAAGFETQFGNMNYYTTPGSYQLHSKTSTFTPRVLLGFKF